MRIFLYTFSTPEIFFFFFLWGEYGEEERVEVFGGKKKKKVLEWNRAPRFQKHMGAIQIP
jgi:hypothetical protein